MKRKHRNEDASKGRRETLTMERSASSPSSSLVSLSFPDESSRWPDASPAPCAAGYIVDAAAGSVHAAAPHTERPTGLMHARSGSRVSHIKDHQTECVGTVAVYYENAWAHSAGLCGCSPLHPPPKAHPNQPNTPKLPPLEAFSSGGECM